jgi:hypothetical protein
MFKQLKESLVTGTAGTVTNQNLRQQIAKLAANISSQLMENGTVIASVSEADFNNFNETMTEALAELITTELIYYFQLSEIGCHLAHAYSNDQSHVSPVSPMPEPPTPRPGLESESNDDDDDDDDENDHEFQGPLRRTMSMPMSSGCPRIVSSSPSPSPSPSPAVAMNQLNQLAANLLIASGRVREQINELAKCLGISIDALGAASFQNVSETDKDRCRLNLVHRIFTFMGGKRGEAPQNDETHCARRVRTVEALCEISKMTWALMNLCVMTNTFRFATESPLFKTAAVDPIESVFGNNGWRARVAHTHDAHTHDADVATTSNYDDYNNYECDDTPSHW